MRSLLIRPNAHAMTKLHIRSLSMYFNNRDYDSIQKYIQMVDENVFFSCFDRQRIFDDWKWTILLYRFVARCVSSRAKRRMVVVNEHTLNYSPVRLEECILLRAINHRFFAFTTHEMVQIMLHSIYHQEFGISKPIVPKNPYTNDTLTPIELRHICSELRRKLTYVPDSIDMFQKARFRLDILESQMRQVLQKKAMSTYCKTMPSIEVLTYVSAFVELRKMSVCRRCIIDSKSALLDWTRDYLLFCNLLLDVTHETLSARLLSICKTCHISIQASTVPHCSLHYRRYRTKADLTSSSWSETPVSPFSPALYECSERSSPFRFTSTVPCDARMRSVRRKRARERPTTAVQPTPPRQPSTQVQNLNLSSVLQLLRTTNTSTTPRPSPLLLFFQMDQSRRNEGMYLDASDRTSMPDGQLASDASDDEDDALFEILGSLFSD